MFSKYRRFTAVIIVLCLSLSLFTGCKQSYRDIVIFESLGNVTVTRDGKVLDAYKDMKLKSGDSISVGSDGYLRLCLDSDKYVYLDSNTLISLISEGKDSDTKTSIYVEMGQVITEIQNKLLGNSSFNVTTPNTSMAIRGTIIYNCVIINPDGSKNTVNSVLEGVVDFVEFKYNGSEIISCSTNMNAGDTLCVETSFAETAGINMFSGKVSENSVKYDTLDSFISNTADEFKVSVLDDEDAALLIDFLNKIDANSKVSDRMNNTVSSTLKSIENKSSSTFSSMTGEAGENRNLEQNDIEETPSDSVVTSIDQTVVQPTITPTFEPTPVIIPEPTTVITPEPTGIITPKPTSIITPEPTEVVTPEVTVVVTLEPTLWPTAEITEEPTPEISVPEEITLTPTEAVTPEPTAVATLTPTAAPTSIPILTPSATPTPSATATPIPTAIITPTPFITDIIAPTNTPTALPYIPTAAPFIPTAVPTIIPEPTSTPTPVIIVSPVNTPVPTAIPTSTPMPTATPVPTAIPTSTPMPTATPVPTATPTPEPAYYKVILHGFDETVLIISEFDYEYNAEDGTYYKEINAFESYNIPTGMLYKDGYVFNGWYLTASPSDEDQAVSDVVSLPLGDTAFNYVNGQVIVGDLNLYADWTMLSKYIFEGSVCMVDSNAATVSLSDIYCSGQTLNSIFTNNDYLFMEVIDLTSAFEQNADLSIADVTAITIDSIVSLYSLGHEFLDIDEDLNNIGHIYYISGLDNTEVSKLLFSNLIVYEQNESGVATKVGFEYFPETFRQSHAQIILTGKSISTGETATQHINLLYSDEGLPKITSGNSISGLKVSCGSYASLMNSEGISFGQTIFFELEDFQITALNVRFKVKNEHFSDIPVIIE